MPVVVTWPIVATTPASSPSAPIVVPSAPPKREQYGIQLPFRMGPRDIATATGDELLEDRIAFVLGQEGQLPWRPQMKMGIDRVRNQNNPAVLQQFGAVYAGDALSKWIPNVRVTSPGELVSSGTSRSLTIFCARTDTTGAKPTNPLTVAVGIPALT